MFSAISQLLKSLSDVERNILLGAMVIFLVAFSFWGLQIFYDITIEAPATGGEYTEGLVGQPTTLNPLIVGSNDIDRDMIELLFADLSELAENIKVENDNKTWTVTLKPKLSWSDGKPLTTSDILFTIEAIQNPDAQSSAFITWQGVVAERLSEREIRFSLKNPYAFFSDNIKRLKIVPRHIFGNIPPSNLRLSNYNLEPIGSGPYKFNYYDKRKDGFITKYKLEVNENYAGQRPLIAKFNVLFFSDEKSAINAFNMKEIDGLGGLDPKKLQELKLGHKIFSINMPRYYAIFFNQSTHQGLKEKTVRKALSDTVDRDLLIKEIFDNQALTINGPVPSFIGGYAPEQNAATSTNWEAISQALEKAGWKLNEENIREKTISRNKIRLEFNISVPQVDFLIKTVELIKNDWGKIGVKLNPIIMTVSDINDAIKTRNYSLIIFGNTLRGNADAFSFWHSSERFYPGLNLSIYSDKTADGLLETIRQESDEETRNTKLAKLQNIIRGDYPAVFLFSPNYLYATPRQLGGFKSRLLVTPSDRFNDINEWYLKTSRKLK